MQENSEISHGQILTYLPFMVIFQSHSTLLAIAVETAWLNKQKINHS